MTSLSTIKKKAKKTQCRLQQDLRNAVLDQRTAAAATDVAAGAAVGAATRISLNTIHASKQDLE